MQNSEIHNWTPQRIENLTGKTYVITGANAGAGYAATEILLSKGASVVMLNRNKNKTKIALENLRKKLGTDIQVSFIHLDLANLASVKKGAAEVLDKVPKIDALLCNAAVAQIAKREYTNDGFESQLGINHYGHFLLTNLLFNRIEQSEGRIVIVSSEGYKMGLKTIQFVIVNLLR